jgi:hypothetical protein
MREFFEKKKSIFFQKRIFPKRNLPHYPTENRKLKPLDVIRLIFHFRQVRVEFFFHPKSDIVLLVIRNGLSRLAMLKNFADFIVRFIKDVLHSWCDLGTRICSAPLSKTDKKRRAGGV